VYQISAKKSIFSFNFYPEASARGRGYQRREEALHLKSDFRFVFYAPKNPRVPNFSKKYQYSALIFILKPQRGGGVPARGGGTTSEI